MPGADVLLGLGVRAFLHFKQVYSEVHVFRGIPTALYFFALGEYLLGVYFYLVLVGIGRVGVGGGQSVVAVVEPSGGLDQLLVVLEDL